MKITDTSTFYGKKNLNSQFPEENIQYRVAKSIQ